MSSEAGDIALVRTRATFWIAWNVGLAFCGAVSPLWENQVFTGFGYASV